MEEYSCELYKRDHLPLVRSFPRVRELFLRVRADGHRIGLASSAKGDELEAYKKLSQIGDLISGETSADDAAESKPHPDIFAAGLKELGDPAPQGNDRGRRHALRC